MKVKEIKAETLRFDFSSLMNRLPDVQSFDWGISLKSKTCILSIENEVEVLRLTKYMVSAANNKAVMGLCPEKNGNSACALNFSNARISITEKGSGYFIVRITKGSDSFTLHQNGGDRRFKVSSGGTQLWVDTRPIDKINWND